MDIAIWIFMCLMACYGAVEAFGRLFYSGRTPRGIGRGCIVVPLREPEKMRSQLEYYLSYAQWNGLRRPIVFVSELEGAQAEYSRVMGGVTGTCLCRPEKLAEILHTVD